MKTIKRICALLMALAMVFALAACASKQAEEAEGSQEEDGQNPVMNFVGPYSSDRASMLVEAEGMTDAKITVSWASSASESSEWTMSGAFDADALTVSYDNCVRTDYVYNESGEVDSETVVYDNGTGTILFAEDGAITWIDDQDHVADGMTFTFNSVPQE